MDNQCKARTTKRAWANRFAPMAQCKHKALDGKHFCARHQRDAAEREAHTPGSSKWMLAERVNKAGWEWKP